MFLGTDCARRAEPDDGDGGGSGAWIKVFFTMLPKQSPSETTEGDSSGHLRMGCAIGEVGVESCLELQQSSKNAVDGDNGAAC